MFSDLKTKNVLPRIRSAFLGTPKKKTYEFHQLDKDLNHNPKGFCRVPLRSYLHPNSLNNKRSKLKCWFLLTWLNNIIAFELQRKSKILDEECVNGISVHDQYPKQNVTI